ncbi:MAG: CPBP family intramembrane glutamic endopeptidase [bacterium]
MNYDELQRIPVYPGQTTDSSNPFLLESGNPGFRRSIMTWISLFILLAFYPGISLIFAEDPTTLAELMNDTMLLITLVATIFMQWCIFLVLYVATFREETGLVGVGLKKIRWLDVSWAVAFLISANLILAGVAWGLAQIGMPMPGELSFLIPRDPLGQGVWVVVSFTAGFCEEVAFRGYLMSRLRILIGTKNWIVPSLISALAFGACHAYQGWPGFIVITVYGLMFSWLYIRTGSLWPGIIAHSLQDLGALFFPH